MQEFPGYTHLTQKEINQHFIDACQHGNVELVQFLASAQQLRHKAQFGLANGRILLAACAKNQVKVVDYLLNSPDTKHNRGEYNNLTIKKSACFLLASSKGYREIVQLTKDVDAITLEQGLIYAIQNKHWNVIHDLLEDERLKKPSMMSDVFKACCIEGHVEMVKLLIGTCPPRYNWHNDNMEGLKKACQHGQLEVVKYLTQPDKILYRHLIHHEYNACLISACENGHLNIVDHLLTAPILKHYINTTCQRNNPLIKAVENGHLRVAQYLIHENHVVMTPQIATYIQASLELNRIVHNKQLNDDLQFLPIKVVSKKKRKI